MRFTDKVCLVTGGTSGIGRACCVRLGAEGGTVIALGRDKAEGAETVRLITKAGGKALFIACDLSKPRAITATVNKVLAKYHRIDVLVCDAAMMTFDHLVDLPLTQWDLLMLVNLRSLAQLTQLCLPHMPAGSAIVAISSVHAHQTTANVVPYATSKGALEAFVRGMSLELDRKQTRINAVAPGAVDTPMLWSNPNVKNGTEKIDKAAVGTPEELAAAIAFMASSEASFVHGTTLVVDGGRLAQL
ncbi:SDR family NAD(P)-dependent oxidoreductase [Hymenobacter artigasi]|uniref:NAD(P)-dependent dehydrogenase (Short-subunit alcohol dehydrogenase family) n=1 Tax=Hymenobacter artigasi TaxID=2719616 RepID=A0ABX1HGF4_9BACT|nr:SDR family oxidoreductase [Hymenobacter artigasi]NKI88930.1 NAD(P)-dependent dehydrogenase (short-subunit alcohol dehydrogenase family) [Hymenobacter artigasi]